MICEFQKRVKRDNNKYRKECSSMGDDDFVVQIKHTNKVSSQTAETTYTHVRDV